MSQSLLPHLHILPLKCVHFSSTLCSTCPINLTIFYSITLRKFFEQNLCNLFNDAVNNTDLHSVEKAEDCK